MNPNTNETKNNPQTAYKYAVYVRKSTEGLERQYRSIEDQIDDCWIIAKRDNLKVIGKPIEERKPAKKSGRKQRPAFYDLIKAIKNGEVDGIIAWHPDRLARNMKDASIILDMLNTGELKDLRFFSHPFSNDPAGRMMLGMMFVLATHYSDELSQKAQRGVKKKFKQGGLGGYPKLGYIQDGGYYKPDLENNNFGLIQQAWQVRASGKTHEEIIEYLQANNFSQVNKGERKVRLITTNALTKMFSDSFYYGVAVQADQTVDLREVLPDFVPLTDEATFAKVQSVNYKRKRGSNKKLEYWLPFRDLIFCATCNDERPMSVYRSKSHSGKYYIYLKCRNETCSRRPKDVRAINISDATQPVLKKVSSGLTAEAYKTYLTETQVLSASHRTALRGENVSLQAQITRLMNDNKDIGKQLTIIQDEGMKQVLQQTISDNMRIVAEQTPKIEANKRKLERVAQPAYSVEEFNGLVQEMKKRYEKGSPVQKDIILRNVFLNLHFDGKKIANYSLKEPFATLLASTELSLGWG
jgi:site-specific DNA recombinase